MAEIPEPKTRLEQYWAGILDKIEGGGGGNPNYIETIEGTLANPWGTHNPSDLWQGLVSKDISMQLSCTISDPIDLYAYPYYGAEEDPEDTDAIMFIYGYITGKSASLLKIYNLTYEKTGGLIIAAQVINRNRTDYDPTSPCTLTIIHHPMPDSGT